MPSTTKTANSELLLSAWKGSCVKDLERRRSPRFALRQPVILSCKNGDPVGRRVEVTILLKQETWPTAARLHGIGKVVRAEENGSAEFLISDQP